MKIIIVGAGEMGDLLAKNLTQEGHDLILIEQNEQVYREIKSSLDVLSIWGDGSNPLVLEQAIEKEADFLIAVTNSDQVNTVSCLIARNFGVRKGIVRINEPDYLLNPLLMDERDVHLVYPEQIVANEIMRLVTIFGADGVEFFAQGKVEMVRVKIGKNSPLIGRPLRLIKLPLSWNFIAASRGEEFMLCNGDTIIQEGDAVIVLGTPVTRVEMENLLGLPTKSAKRTVILGGGKTGLYLANQLIHRKISVRLIEQDPVRAKELAGQLPQALVIQGDGADDKILKEANISHADYFVALTRDDELNVLSSLLAKNLGAGKIVVLSRKPQYRSVIERIGIDTVISPRVTAVSKILQFVRRAEVQSLSLVEEGKAQIIELIAQAGSKGINKPLKKINFPAGTLVGLIVRREEVIIPRGDQHVEPGDKIILFALPEVVGQVEKFFAGPKETVSI